jgi:tetratricopeptide (TPR) repeat protein
VWQSLAEELKGEAFDVVAVALDTAEAARPWIESAQPGYRCLIDADHHVAALYNLVNVPQAVWIDETGRIVRPPETAGSTDAFRALDRRTNTLPEAMMAERQRVKAAYLDAVRDWARRGSRSPNALAASQAAAGLPLPDDAVAEAHAHFRLAQHLRRIGREDEAQAAYARATALHPDSWARWRQAAPKDARGLAAGGAFWARVEALGERPYYPPARIVAPQG